MPDPNTSPQGPPMAVIWQRLSLHLQALAETTRTLEKAAAKGQSKALGPETIKQLQAFDFIEQSLDDIALLAGDLGRAEIASKLSASTLHTITKKLRLASTKGLLAPGDGGITRPFQEQNVDETILF